MALRLGRYFRMSQQFWLGQQMNHGLDVTEDARAGTLSAQRSPTRGRLTVL